MRDEWEEVEEELRHHLEERTREYEARGMDPESARRAALERLGDLAGVKRECASLLAADRRRKERRALARVSWLDVKLGLRMLVKYPGLTFVSLVGMAVAVVIAGGTFGSVQAIMDATLPFPDGERIVAVENRDLGSYGSPDRRLLHDYILWSREVESVRELSAFRTAPRNLIHTDGRTELVQVAEITASGLQVSRVDPILGRSILEEDEPPGAAPVVVIGHGEWQRRFEGDPAVIGRTLRLGSTVHTVVGVMPEGFRFPINHAFWVPLHLDPGAYERGEGPDIHVFGRLADGVTLEGARAELATIGRATAAERPETHARLQPHVLPYTAAYGVDIDDASQALFLRLLPLAVIMVLVLVAVNVAILIYARTATRLGEIAVRSALGASRRRIVIQLFVEALVLAVAATAAGLAVVGFALPEVEAWMRRVSPGRIPFWYDFGLTPGLVVYVAGLAVLAGVIVGVVPGLKATGRKVHQSLQQLSARSGRLRLGRLWSGLIVAQVAFAVAVLPFVLHVTRLAVEGSTTEVAYDADEFLRVRLSLAARERAPGTGAAAHTAEARTRLRDAAAELIRRLEAEPEVAAVTFGSHFPDGGSFERVEVEDGGTQRARIASVATDLFSVFDVPVLAGRALEPADLRDGPDRVVVDRVFVESVLGGGAAVGRRVRLVSGADDPTGGGAGPWMEIVGVVPRFASDLPLDESLGQIYRPMALAEATGLSLAVRVPDDAAGFAPDIRDLAAAVDPDLQLTELQTAAAYQGFAQTMMRFVSILMTAVTVSVLLLSAGGIYALMSFTVARRRREIGIRSALGAAPRRVLMGIFSRAAAQIGLGILVGLAVAVGASQAVGGGPFSGKGLILLPAVAGLMSAVGLLAALGPARRGLAVEPTEALQAE